MKYNATLTEWFTVLTSSVANASFVKLALTRPTPEADDLKSVDVRPIMVKRELKLSFTYHHKTRDIVKNYTPDESLPILAKLLAKTFLAGRIYTLKEDILIAKQGSNYVLTNHGATQKQAAELTHDRPKQRLIEDTAKPYLHALGLTDTQGNVLKSAQDKYRQINKYIEILDGLIKQLPPQKSLRVIDMGSGKGYLTFALYDHLTTTLKRNTQVTGIEYRTDLVTLCNTIAQQSGFTGLQFKQGIIADADCTGTDIVIALHACDTATDDAIHKAVQAGAGLIVVAPCCHKQIRRDMKTNAKHPLDFMLKFGTYTERMAEMVTDALRAQLLELSGYTTNLFEFISDAHTPKNVMIVATKSASPLGPEEATRLRTAIAAAKAQFGIHTHQLERLLNQENIS